MTATCDLPQLTIGDDYAASIQFWTDATKTVKVDLSARTYAAKARVRPGATDAVVLTVDTTNAATGLLVVRLAAASTALLAPARYGWDLQQTNSGVVSTLLSGHWQVVGDYTR